MMQTAAIAGRELRAYFLSPAGYVITALFIVVCGMIFFLGGFQQGQVASLQPVFAMGTWMLSFIGPAIAMRLLSEEYRSGTYEMLITCPVREREVIVGKFFGAVGFLIIMLVPTAIFVVALELYGRPDYGELACGYLGMLLAGSAYIASGVLASTLTSSQAVAFLMAVFVWLGVGVATRLLPIYLDDPWAKLVFSADPALRLHDFTAGLLDTANVVYFLAITTVCLIAASVLLQARRWT
jgi:ABC-2 type transport system permease protein